MLQSIGWIAPWLLVALAALPILWLLLRAVPPAPVKRLFPAVALLIGLKDGEHETDRTPWWLMLLRMFAVAAIIVGLAGPVFNPKTQTATTGPLLILTDGGWASAATWSQREALIAEKLSNAARRGRTVALVSLADPQTPIFQPADVWQARLAGVKPMPWSPKDTAVAGIAHDLPAGTEIYWISDGLDYSWRDTAVSALQQFGPLTVFETGKSVMALRPANFADGAVQLQAVRTLAGSQQALTISALGRDPQGNETVLARTDMVFLDGERVADTSLILPAELQARVSRYAIEGVQSAGAISLSDDSLRRREVLLVSGRNDREGLELLSPLHYLERALAPSVTLLKGSLTDMLPANPDAVILADIATLSPSEETALTDWIDGGGALVRFAGPRLAASDVSRDTEHALMPVRLRAGGRTVGDAMSWGSPKELSPFAEGSPFYGLSLRSDITVSSQVMAQPDPTLSDRVIAQLSDGTPLVTRKPLGDGHVVLFHISANAEWSTLPLSGLFVEMLERLSVSSSVSTPEAQDLEGTVWTPIKVLDGFGSFGDADALGGVDGPDLVSAPLGRDMRAGVYQSDDRMLARNVMAADQMLDRATWPASVPVERIGLSDTKPLGGWLLAVALALLAADVLATLFLSGKLGLRARGMTAVIALALVPNMSDAQTISAQDSANNIVFGHILTGDQKLDDLAYAGMRGLSKALFDRTTVEPIDPVSVDLERDDITLLPFLYWPISPDQPIPSDAAYEKLNRYLRTGGMILFDTRDADTAGFGASSPAGKRLQQLAVPLDIPPLEPVPEDHVLTRAFYLLQDFPGRHIAGTIWVEAAPPDAERAEGMPFRNLNDGVTPVVIGGNDWAAAWAINASGRPVTPIGRGYSGERQRELARRFGVNLIMHVLTGNYKSDQVHVPALLERLGQ